MKTLLDNIYSNNNSNQESGKTNSSIDDINSSQFDFLYFVEDYLKILEPELKKDILQRDSKNKFIDDDTLSKLTSSKSLIINSQKNKENNSFYNTNLLFLRTIEILEEYVRMSKKINDIAIDVFDFLDERIKKKETKIISKEQYIEETSKKYEERIENLKKRIVSPKSDDMNAYADYYLNIAFNLKYGIPSCRDLEKGCKELDFISKKELNKDNWSKIVKKADFVIVITMKLREYAKDKGKNQKLVKKLIEHFTNIYLDIQKKEKQKSKHSYAKSYYENYNRDTNEINSDNEDIDLS